MAAESDGQLYQAAIQETTAVLRKQAEAVLAELDALAEATAGCTSAKQDAPDARVAAAIRRHSLDCTIKLGWAAAAVAMYRRALEQPVV